MAYLEEASLRVGFGVSRVTPSFQAFSVLYACSLRCELSAAAPALRPFSAVA